MRRVVLLGALVSISSACVLAAGCGGSDGVAVPTLDSGADTSTSKDGAVDAAKDSAITDAVADVKSGGDSAVFVWPDCNAKPSTAKAEAITAVWADNPTQPVETWISGAYVTGISRGACTVNQACQIFLQQDLTYASLAAGAKHGIKMFISAAAAQYFTTISVGDQVDALGFAQRYTLGGQNELLVQVNQIEPGCAKKTGTGVATPIESVLLSDLSVSAYENTIGPLLVKVSDLIGTPGTPGETFGLGNAVFDGGGSDAGSDIVSLSPFFLANAQFVGLTNGLKTKFFSVAGIFGLFVPPTDGAVAKYLEIYPRTMADVSK
ncbi:hypothetical protein BH09MYX1_BH09MYX1_67570 [soil metagenome]